MSNARRRYQQLLVIYRIDHPIVSDSNPPHGGPRLLKQHEAYLHYTLADVRIDGPHRRMIVVADTTPINYLILTEQIDALFTLYGRVVFPVAVQDELLSENAPAAVRSWTSRPPVWIEIRTGKTSFDSTLDKLDAGEREAIVLAEELDADQLIVDEVLGRKLAMRRGLSVIGTIGVIREAAMRGLLDVHNTIARLRSTSFHISPEILAALMRQFPQP